MTVTHEPPTDEAAEWVDLAVSQNAEIKRLRAENDTLRHRVAALEAVGLEINRWLGANPDWDLHYEPPWYQQFLSLTQQSGEKPQRGRE